MMNSYLAKGFDDSSSCPLCFTWMKFERHYAIGESSTRQLDPTTGQGSNQPLPRLDYECAIPASGLKETSAREVRGSRPADGVENPKDDSPLGVDSALAVQCFDSRRSLARRSSSSCWRYCHR